MKSTNLFLLLLTLTLITVASCKYDPILPVNNGNGGGGGVDTTGNGGGGGTGGNPCSPDSVYFNKDILPLFSSTCAQVGCHDAITQKEGINMTNYNSIIKKLVPGKASSSKIYKSLVTTEQDDRMPRPPSLPLSQDKIALIAKWINQGAKNNFCDDSGNCDLTNVTYSNTIKPILNTYCTGCHSGGAPQGGIDLNSYNTVQVYAKNGRLSGAVNWTSGYVAMPYKSTKLNACNISKIKTWIDAGALNN